MFELMECGMMLNRKRSVESRRESLTAFFFTHAEVKDVKEWLSIDTSELNKTLKEIGTALRPEQMNIALRHTIQDVGRRVRTLSKKEIRKEYRAKSGRIDKAIRRPVYSLNGTISCIIPIMDARGTIATKSGAYTALKRGPGAKVVKSANSILPHNRTDMRIHFYIPSGRLNGHVFVRHNDGKKWIGKRSEKDRIKKTRMRKGSLSHGVGIGIPQMPMNRAAEGIQNDVAQYAMKRLLHYQEQILKGNVKR